MDIASGIVTQMYVYPNFVNETMAMLIIYKLVVNLYSMMNISFVNSIRIRNTTL